MSDPVPSEASAIAPDVPGPVPRSLAATARVLRAIAIVALLAMVAVTVMDITMRVAIDELVLGSVEIVQWMLVAVVFLAIPESVLREEHVTVDVIDHAVSERTRGLLRLTGAATTLLLLGVMAWRVVPPAVDTIAIGDRTTDLQISLFWYWLPIVVGVFAAAAAAFYRVLSARPKAAGARARSGDG